MQHFKRTAVSFEPYICFVPGQKMVARDWLAKTARGVAYGEVDVGGVCCHPWSRAGTTIKTVVKRGFLQRKRIYFYLVKSAHGARFLKKRNIDILPLIFIEQFVCGNVSASRYSNAAPMASLIFMSQNRIPSARSMDDKDRPRICRFESFHRVSSTAPLTIPPKKTNVSPKKKKRSDEIL